MSLSSSRSRWRLFGSVGVLVVSFVVGASGLAGAQPSEPDSPPAPPPSPAEAPVPGVAAVPLSTLGMGRVLAFPGQEHEVALTLPVLPGMAPMELVGTVQLPPYVARGTLEVISGERLLDRVNLPLERDAPVRLSLAGAEVENNAIAVTLSSALVPEVGTCITDWLGRPMTLSDPAVGYSGREVQPSTVAEFLPPVLRRLTVYLPERPSQVESAAALEMLTAVVARYDGQPVAVDLRSMGRGATAPDHAPEFLERQIALAESADTGLRLTADGPGPLLTVSGTRDTLPDQIRLLTSDLARIALTSGATAVSLPAAPQLPPEVSTLSDLGETRLSATAIGVVSVDIGIDQSRLGRPTRDIRVRLLGNYTPLPQTLNGQITVTARDRQIDSWPVDASGRIERWIEIPDELLGRFTTLTVTLAQTGLTHGCGLEQPVTLAIDPASEITGDEAKPPVPPGFQSLPQAMLPTVQVGLREPGFADTRRAARILVGMQRLTPVPLRPELVSFDTAVNGTDPVVLIAADGDVPESIRLPLSRSGDRITVYSGPSRAELRIDPLIPFGSLQATWSNDRAVLVATSTAEPERVDRMLDWLDGDPDRWSRLTGNVLYQTGDRDPEYFDPQEVVAGAPGDSADIPVARILTIAGAVVLGLGLVAGLLILARRRRDH
ncbi:hypothetical protein [Nocardia sp. CC201C]|uniref:hypothetical protein n=1 Tax=Nocardia sp. CC201C TaxID=3044575 RepID=UPI0024A88DD1|nr:hypothetical protein [Nocardia sp. CC201C]